MADPKYVCIAKIGVTDAFDTKYKTTLPKLIRATIEKAINDSDGFTTKPPTDKKETGYAVDGNLISLDKNEKGNAVGLDAKMSMQVMEWPSKSMFGFLKGGGGIPNANPKKLDGDVEALVKSILQDLVNTKVIPALQTREKAKAK